MLKKETLIKAQEFFLFLTIVCLPVYALPVRFRIYGVGGKLSYYTLLIGLIIFLFEWMKYGIRINKKIYYYMGALLILKFFITVHGVIAYPYYENIQLFIPSKIISLINHMGIQTNNMDHINAGYLAIRSFKLQFMELLTTFTVSLWIYHLYLDKFEEGYHRIRKFALILSVLLGVYAIPEILLFKFHCQIGYSILQTTNPFLYDVKSYLDWYPPLVWSNNQLRSYCVEPSVFGGLAGFIIPFLWIYIYEHKLYMSFFYSYFVMLLFMTKARISNVVFMFDIFLLPFFYYVVRAKKCLIMILILSVIGFGMNLLDSSIFIGQKVESGSVTETTGNKATEYFDNNIKTITDGNARSNGSRLINIKSHIDVIIHHPILGTGVGLKDLYVRDNLTSGALKNGEISDITNGINKEGILKGVYNKLCK